MNLSCNNIFPVAQSVSTNDDAFALLDRYQECCVWTLDQRGGRGSRGRQWLAPKDSVLAISLGFQGHLGPPPEDFCYPLFAGILVFEALAGFGVEQLALKWPNDLLLQGRKLAGILCETRWLGNARTMVTGIGINLRKHPQLKNLPKGYAALEESGVTPPASEIVDCLCRLWLQWAEKLAQPSALNRAWLARSSLTQGAQVVVRADGRNHRGRLTGLTKAGNLVLTTPEGVEWVFDHTCRDFSLAADTLAST